MRTALTITMTLALAASAALAHTGVKDPQVKARMDGMKTMAAKLKTLGQMAKGVVAYDASRAEAALAALNAETARIPTLFAPQASDPKSEATLTIWTDPEGFATSTASMAAALETTDVSSPEEIRISLRAVATACSACHQDYRVRQ